MLADVIIAEMAKGWHARRSTLLDAMYQDRYKADRSDYSRKACWLASVIYCLFSIVDYLVVPDIAFILTIARLLLVTIFVVLVEMQFRRHVAARQIDYLFAFGLVLANINICVLLTKSIYVSSVQYYFFLGAVFIMAPNALCLFESGLAAATSIFITLFVSHAVTWVAPAERFEYLVLIYSLFATTLSMTLFVNWQLNKQRFSVFLNTVLNEIRQAELAERSAALLKLSTTDALTGLANRRLVDQELRALWTDWQANGAEFAVILVDIDFFKRFNDRYGHDGGDDCLVAVAGAMEGVAKANDAILGRQGGEEFIALVGSPAVQRGAALAEELRRSIEALNIAHENRLDQKGCVTISVGIAFCRDVTEASAEKVVSAADHALYRAKTHDRNCVCTFSPDGGDAASPAERLTALLQTAIMDGRASLETKPVLDGDSSAGVAA